ncbi:divalent-cation tolerance protein CutA [candidate division WOR-3 bacterium]|nr:divalent-cation tolerance protein CutA [candidate division WOR-3 bacterium]
MKALLIYITASDKEEAVKIAESLVSKKLAACANIIEGVDSVYHWKGKVQRSKESVVIAKTASELLDDLTSEIIKIHSYECPCVAAFEISGGNESFLKWIDESVEKNQV